VLRGAAAGEGLAWGPVDVVDRLERVTEQRVLRGLCPADETDPHETGLPFGGPDTPFPPGLYGPGPG
jgi:glutamate--cysteine ligase